MHADPTESQPTDRWLSTAEAAEVLEMTPGYVRRLARQETLVGKRSENDGRETWTFDPAIVHQFASTRRRSAASGYRSAEIDGSGAEWTAQLLLAENADLQHQLMADRLRHAERRVSELEANNAALRSEVDTWKALVHSLSAPQTDRK